MKRIEYEEIKLLKESEKSIVLLVREMDGEQVFVHKTLKGRRDIYSELLNCEHSYLPKIYEDNMSGGTTTVIEEYIDGQPLGCAVLSEKQLRNAFKELCAVLGVLHKKGIIHRDIKPSNIILAKDGHIRLIDFDAARMPKDNLDQDTRLLGTRGYAPPEQYGFSQTDTRADIYSLGVTLGKLLGGKAKKYRYRKIIKKCTDLNPDKRYQTVKQVEEALDFPYHVFLFLPVVFACIIGVLILKHHQAQEEPAQMKNQIETLTQYTNKILLFEAKNSEYIIMSELDSEQGKTANMRVDMTGNGDFVDFSIAYNNDHMLAGTIAKLVDGDNTGLWYPLLQELLHGIPYKQQFSDENCIIQITCVDADGDGIKEVFVSRGDGKHAVVTLVWQYISGGNGSPDCLKPVGTMWGITTMRLAERGEIKIIVNNLLPEFICYYDKGFLGELEGVYLTTYKEFQEREYRKNNMIQEELSEFNPLESFPSGENLFNDYNVKWGIYPY